MLAKLLQHLRNWFLIPGGIHTGKFIIKEGSVELPFLLDGQYFRVIGSVFNDGIHKYPGDDLKDETFEGTIWALAVPPDVVKLAKRIEAWIEKNPESPYVSESFGGYSYTKASNGRTGQAVTWADVFSSELNQWRKI